MYRSRSCNLLAIHVSLMFSKIHLPAEIYQLTNASGRFMYVTTHTSDRERQAQQHFNTQCTIVMCCCRHKHVRVFTCCIWFIKFPLIGVAHVFEGSLRVPV